MLAMAALPDQETKTYHIVSSWEPIILCLTGTSFGFPCLMCFPGPTNHELTLAPEEVILTSSNTCTTAKRRLPYGELGGVDKVQNCGCDAFGGGSLGVLQPGWGGAEEAPLISEILATLKRRQQSRGDQGQIQRAEEANVRMQRLEAKLDAIIKHMNVSVPPFVPASAPIDHSISPPPVQHMTTSMPGSAIQRA